MERVKKIVNLVLILSISMCVLFIFPYSSNAKTLKLGHCLAPDSHYAKGAAIFADLIKEKTNGRYDIKVYHQATIGDERELVEGMDGGFIDMSIVSTGLYSGFVPKIAVLDIPFLFSGPEHVDKVLNGPIGQKFINLISDKTNIQPLAFFENGFRQMTNSIRPIKNSEDIKGLKIRNPAWPTHISALEALDAVPVTIAFAELYTSLDTKAVDGQHNACVLIVTSKLYEPQKFLSIMDWSYGATLLSCSGKLWKSLSPADQKIFKDAAVEAGIQQRKLCLELEKEATATLSKYLKITYRNDVDKASFQKIIEEKAYPKFESKYGSFLKEIISSR